MQVRAVLIHDMHKLVESKSARCEERRLMRSILSNGTDLSAAMLVRLMVEPPQHDFHSVGLQVQPEGKVLAVGKR